MSKLRCAVIGVGYLGRFHAQKFALLSDEVELVAVADANPARAAEIGAEFDCRALSDHRHLLGQVDAVSVVADTRAHHLIARDFLSHGTHVLIEKPITVSVAEADELISLAERAGRVLQVGHIERFNPVWRDGRQRVRDPHFIEAHRLAPFKSRGTDVSVILDLMIHDIDLVLSVVNSRVADLRASGAPVLTEGVDIVNARIEFFNGCVANLTASRVSAATMRKMRLFQDAEYLAFDFQERSLISSRRADDVTPPIASETTAFPPDDALLEEVRAFIAAIQDKAPVLVPGQAGRDALALALEISREVGAHSPPAWTPRPAS